jgi:hypothetical protein
MLCGVHSVYRPIESWANKVRKDEMPIVSKVNIKALVKKR